MRKGLISLVSVVVMLAAAIAGWQVWPNGDSVISSASTIAQLSQNWGQLPLSFEANKGQTDAPVAFLARGQGYTLFLTSTEAVLSLTKSSTPQRNTNSALAKVRPVDSSEPKGAPPTVLRMQLVDANPSAKVIGLDQLPGKTNYLIGNDPAQWRTGIAYEAV